MLSRVEMCQTALRNMRKYVYLRDCQNKCSMKSATLEYREPMRPKIDYISTEKQTFHALNGFCASRHFQLA